MCTDKEIEQLKHRYDLRAAGAQVRDMIEDMPDYMHSTDDRLRVLDNVSGKMKGKDKLFFRQGFLFRAGE